MKYKMLPCFIIWKRNDSALKYFYKNLNVTFSKSDEEEITIEK